MKKLIQILCLYLVVSYPIQAVELGDPAPNCELKHFKTQENLNINDLLGKVVYIDFWASWCPTCKKAFPALNQLHQELNAKGFEVFTVNLDEERKDADEFLRQHPVDFAVAYDDKKACPNRYHVLAMPASYIIDKQGIIRDIHLGFEEGDIIQVRNRILALLEE